MMEKDHIKVQPLCDKATKEQGILRRTEYGEYNQGFLMMQHLNYINNYGAYFNPFIR